MGLQNIGIVQILIVLLIVLLIFGTKRIRSLGSDLGGAIREFRKGVSEDGGGDGDNTSEPGSDSDDGKDGKASGQSER